MIKRYYTNYEDMNESDDGDLCYWKEVCMDLDEIREDARVFKDDAIQTFLEATKKKDILLNEFQRIKEMNENTISELHDEIICLEARFDGCILLEKDDYDALVKKAGGHYE